MDGKGTFLHGEKINENWIWFLRLVLNMGWMCMKMSMPVLGTTA